GDFNGDGFPDLAIANNVVPGVATVLLNAADWHAGGATIPLGGPGLDPAAPDPVAIQALGTPSNFPALRSFTSVTSDLPSDSVRQGTVLLKTGPSGQPEAASQTRPLFPIRHAVDAVFERWGDE